MAELDKIRWHCRRGMLELDLVLEKFNERHLPGLGPEQLDRYQELLEFQGNDSLDLVMGRGASPDRHHDDIPHLLRAVLGHPATHDSRIIIAATSSSNQGEYDG